MPTEPSRVPIGRVAQVGLIALVVVLVMIVIFWRPTKEEAEATADPKRVAESEGEMQGVHVTTTPKAKPHATARQTVRLSSKPLPGHAVVIKKPAIIDTKLRAQTIALKRQRAISLPMVRGVEQTSRATLQHIMSDDDTLYSIAKKYYGRGSAWRLIAKANKLKNPNKIPLGTRLVIPSARKSIPARRLTTKVADPLQPAGTHWHLVKSGENYIKIAKQYWGVSTGWRKIMKINGYAANQLPVGKKILIPAR